MAIEPIGAISSIAAPTEIAVSQKTTALSDFGQVLSDGIAKMDASVQVADQQVRELAAGKNISVHDVMISMEQARMNLMFMVEVRNRAVDAYQELMRMQL